MPIEVTRAEPAGAELAGVLVDPLRPKAELRVVAEQMPVVVEIVHVDLEAAIPDLVKKRQGDSVPLLRHDLERRLDSVAVVHVHQPRAAVTPDQGLDVVGDDGTARGAIGPEPHERHPGDTPALEGKE